MIDLHTHTILSDGVLLPSELVRRAVVNGLAAIAITDHADHSNIETVLTGLVKVSKVINRYWDIYVMPGVEITHVPLETIPELVAFARNKGARIVVMHGESPVEPVIKGTNRAAIEAGVDIVAHPGDITDGDVKLAATRGVHLEITTRSGHNKTNQHVYDTAMKYGAKLVLNTDTHSPSDILSRELFERTLAGLGASKEAMDKIETNSLNILKRIAF